METLAAPALRFAALGIDAARSFAHPALLLRVEIGVEDDRSIRAIALGVEVRIAADRRRYSSDEIERLTDLFGAPESWARSLGPLPWVQTTINVAPFAGSTVVEIPLPCSYDFDVAAAKYLAALDGGQIPIELLFRGDVFFTDGEQLRISRIPWDAEVSSNVPVQCWREAVDAAFPNSGWIRIGRATLARLQAFRARGGFSEWDSALEALLGNGSLDNEEAKGS